MSISVCPSNISAPLSAAYNGSIYNTCRPPQLNEDMLRIATIVGKATATISLARLLELHCLSIQRAGRESVAIRVIARTGRSWA